MTDYDVVSNPFLLKLVLANVLSQPRNQTRTGWKAEITLPRAGGAQNGMVEISLVSSYHFAFSAAPYPRSEEVGKHTFAVIQSQVSNSSLQPRLCPVRQALATTIKEPFRKKNNIVRIIALPDPQLLTPLSSPFTFFLTYGGKYLFLWTYNHKNKTINRILRKNL